MEAAYEHMFTKDWGLWVQRVVCPVRKGGRVSICVPLQPKASLRAWQTARGAVEQGKDWTIGPQGGNNKGHGIKFVEEKAKV